MIYRSRVDNVDEAKKILESAGYLVERTPLEARTDDRFKVPALSKVPEKIENRIKYFKYFLHYINDGDKDYADDFKNVGLEIINTALKNYGPIKLYKLYDYDWKKDKSYLKAYVNLAELDRNGLIKNKDILDKLIRSLKKTFAYTDYNGIYIKNIEYEYGDIVSNIWFVFSPTDKRPSDFSAAELLSIRTNMIKSIRETVDKVAMKVNDIINKWEKSYNKAWKNESYRLTEGRINLQAFRQSVFDLAVDLGANYEAAYDAAKMIDMDMAKETTVEELAREIAQEYPAR